MTSSTVTPELTEREKGLIRNELAIEATQFGDLEQMFKDGHRNAVRALARKLEGMITVLDAIGWYTHDEPQGSITEGALIEHARYEIEALRRASVEAPGPNDEETVVAFRKLAESS